MSAVHLPFPPEHSPLRRRILQGMLSAGALTLVPGDLLAQWGVPLYKLPRYALIIGNGSYANTPLILLCQIEFQSFSPVILYNVKHCF